MLKGIEPFSEGFVRLTDFDNWSVHLAFDSIAMLKIIVPFGILVQVGERLIGNHDAKASKIVAAKEIAFKPLYKGQPKKWEMWAVMGKWLL